MSNVVTAFFETLVAAAGEYNAAPVGRTALIDRVYQDVSTESGRIGQTVNVYFPDIAPLVDVGAGLPNAVQIDPGYTPMVFQNHPCAAIQFNDFQQFQTATEIATKFFDPLHKRAREYLNGQIAALITPANFASNAPLIGARQGEVQVSDLLTAWSNLADQKCPLEDTERLSLFHHNLVNAKMLADSAWVQENIISAAVAEKARTKAQLSQAFQFTPIWDQQMPTASGSVIYGQVALTSGSATVAGLNTAFTSQLTAGTSYLTFGCDATKTQYAVSAIASDTSLTLGSNYTGAVPSGAGMGAYTVARLITVVTGTVGTTSASAAVTGSGTTFTSLSPGQWLVFSGDPTNTPYQIQSITSNTALTLASNFVGTTATGQKATVQSFTCLAAHSYAIGLAMRPIATPPESADVVHVAYIDLKGIPLRVMVSYQHLKMGLYVTADFGYALGVLRPQWGQLIQV